MATLKLDTGRGPLAMLSRHGNVMERNSDVNVMICLLHLSEVQGGGQLDYTIAHLP